MTIDEQFDYMNIHYLMNPEKWGETQFRATRLKAFHDSITNVIISENLDESCVHSIIEAYTTKIEELELPNRYQETTISERLSYWDSKSFSQVQKASLQLDLHISFSEIIRKLFFEVDISGVNFNVLDVIIIENSNEVEVGQPYIAKIGLCGYDSTNVPAVEIGGDLLKTENGFGVYQEVSSIRGEKVYRGNVTLYDRGLVRTKSFEESYIVK